MDTDENHSLAPPFRGRSRSRSRSPTQDNPPLPLSQPKTVPTGPTALSRHHAPAQKKQPQPTSTPTANQQEKETRPPPTGPKAAHQSQQQQRKEAAAASERELVQEMAKEKEKDPLDPTNIPPKPRVLSETEKVVRFLHFMLLIFLNQHSL